MAMIKYSEQKKKQYYRKMEVNYIRQFSKIKVSDICRDLGINYGTKFCGNNPRMIRLEIQRRLKELEK